MSALPTVHRCAGLLPCVCKPFNFGLSPEDNHQTLIITNYKEIVEEKEAEKDDDEDDEDEKSSALDKL